MLAKTVKQKKCHKSVFPKDTTEWLEEIFNQYHVDYNHVAVTPLSTLQLDLHGCKIGIVGVPRLGIKSESFF